MYLTHRSLLPGATVNEFGHQINNAKSVPTSVFVLFVGDPPNILWEGTQKWVRGAGGGVVFDEIKAKRFAVNANLFALFMCFFGFLLVFADLVLQCLPFNF